MTKDLKKGWREIRWACPYCGIALLATDVEGGRVQVWCGRPQCQNIGANEGATGKNELEAFYILMRKLGKAKI